MIDGLYSAGIDAADELLRDVYRLEVAKALDPLDARDFLVIVQRLARALTGVSRDAEAAALRSALATLDVDWPSLSTAARDQVIRAARQAVNSLADKVLPRVDQIFEVEAKNVVTRARRTTVRRFGLHIAASTSRADERIAAFVRKSESNFVRDQYRRRSDEVGQRARDIVAASLEQGLGRDEIAADLSAGLASIVNRGKPYWEVVAMSFANRGRTYTQLAAFDDAGVERYRFEAVRDEVTCIPGGARIATASGEVAIERVVPGCAVWTHLGRLSLVQATSMSRRPRLMCFVHTGNGGLCTTANHPFLVRRNGQLMWLTAGELVPSDRVLMRRQCNAKAG
jgi:hypothetical protein